MSDTSTGDDHHFIEPGEALLKYLREERHGSKAHVMYELIWESGFRMCTVRHLDVDEIQSLQTGGR